MWRPILPALLGRRLSPVIGIDLGTTSTLIAVQGEGLVVDEPSVVAIERATGHVLGRGTAIGRLAKQMVGRTPDSIQAVKPIRGGAITDFAVCEALLRYLVTKACPTLGRRPTFVVSVPSRLTSVERQAVLNSSERAGAGHVLLLDESKAAAIGAGLPIAEPLASIVCDIGGGTTDVAALSLGDTIASGSEATAGDAFNEAIVLDLRRRHRIRISDGEAEQLKCRIGSASELPTELESEVRGRDIGSGIPRRVIITSEEVRAALAAPLETVVETIQRVLEQLDTTLVADAADCGLILTGGGSQLTGLPEFLERRLGLPVQRDDNPRHAVIRGLGICLDHFDVWQERLERDAALV